MATNNSVLFYLHNTHFKRVVESFVFNAGKSWASFVRASLLVRQETIADQRLLLTRDGRDADIAPHPADKMYCILLSAGHNSGAIYHVAAEPSVYRCRMSQ